MDLHAKCKCLDKPHKWMLDDLIVKLAEGKQTAEELLNDYKRRKQWSSKQLQYISECAKSYVKINHIHRWTDSKAVEKAYENLKATCEASNTRAILLQEQLSKHISKSELDDDEQNMYTDILLPKLRDVENDINIIIDILENKPDILNPSKQKENSDTEEEPRLADRYKLIWTNFWLFYFVSMVLDIEHYNFSEMTKLCCKEHLVNISKL